MDTCFTICRLRSGEGGELICGRNDTGDADRIGAGSVDESLVGDCVCALCRKELAGAVDVNICGEVDPVESSENPSFSGDMLSVPLDVRGRLESTRAAA